MSSTTGESKVNSTARTSAANTAVVGDVPHGRRQRNKLNFCRRRGGQACVLTRRSPLVLAARTSRLVLAKCTPQLLAQVQPRALHAQAGCTLQQVWHEADRNLRDSNETGCATEPVTMHVVRLETNRLSLTGSLLPQTEQHCTCIPGNGRVIARMRTRREEEVPKTPQTSHTCSRSVL